MTNTQFGWLLIPQILMLLAIIGRWAKYRFQHWTSELKLRLYCPRHRSAGPAGNAATWAGTLAGPHRAAETIDHGLLPGEWSKRGLPCPLLSC